MNKSVRARVAQKFRMRWNSMRMWFEVDNGDTVWRPIGGSLDINARKQELTNKQPDLTS